MRLGASPTTLFLDFDGVICDSLEECFRSSWLTGEGVEVNANLPPDPPFDASYRSRFNACRPFIRSGEDYLVVHEWAAQGRVPADQAEFDESLNAKGPAVLAELKRRLYAVREALLERHHALWLSWNPLYAGMGEVLGAQAANPAVWILSTKKAEFIGEILSHHGVSWPAARTVYTGTQKKLDLIESLLGNQPSRLIDDQVDHLDFGHPSCHCDLALWGYVAPGASTKAGSALTLPQALEVIRSFPSPHRAG